MDKENSLTRSKKTVSSLADILLKEGVNTLLPGSTLVYEVGKLAIQHGKQYFTDRTEQRLHDFHLGIVQSETNDEVNLEGILKKTFNLDEYHAVLNACVQDIENEKTEIYSVLMKSLMVKEITTRHRRFFITVTKQLTFTEIELIRKLYINSSYDLMTVGGTSQQITSILTSHDALTDITIRTLVSYGLVANDRKDMTSLGKLYAEVLFEENKLPPKSINRQEYTKINVAILNYMIGDKTHDQVSRHLHESLWSHGVKSSILALDYHSVHQAPLLFNAGVLILGDVEYDEKHFDRRAIAEFASKVPVFPLNIKPNKLKISSLGLKSSIDLKENEPNKVRKEIYSSVEEIFKR
ncbi:hypothetical protein [Photobacterium sp. GB-210]|uniref:hypothetical protein n=1 Tax=Photobacterium sp. GB-210 TaxID=2022104 RepID=UPI000D158969|nr:hypothetical protein [Photobacterium sp. GB-210]PSV34619.1 hypothetical protein C9J38_17905 [Photobacterium sp. GB-210]